jgi:uncharacterized protein YegJ (DUF2314 family)
MSQSEPSQVFMFDDSDPEMRRAYEQARSTFRYFWREVAWERRRIIPGLDVACVKAPFSDGKPRSTPQDASEQDGPEVEQMWLGEVDFDGHTVSGVLLNSPNWLTSIQAGDAVRVPLAQITDWMYAISGEVYGAYTVNLMRSRMGASERKEHDNAWGLNFGDPHKIRLVPEPKKSGGLLKSLFGSRGEVEIGEHPMSENMAPSLKEQLAANPTMLHAKDENGWTLLHQEALAGSAPTVQVLLDHGAEVNAVTAHGATPLQLAKSLGWDKVAALLMSKGAR